MSSLYRYYRYEATLFDGTSTTEVVSGETAFWDSTHDDATAAVQLPGGVAATYTGVGQTHEGWDLQSIHFWPIFLWVA
jgi:hypothetical protein